MIGKRSKAIDL